MSLAHIDIQEAHQFIDDVELAPLSATEFKAFIAAAGDPNSTAYVNRGSIQYHPLPAQSKTDALNWTLFGQLAADAKVNREIDPEGWYQEYVSVLGRVGMRANGWRRESASGSEVGTSVDSAVLRCLKPFLSPGAREKLDQIINSLKQAANEHSLDIFNSSSSDTSSANFHVSDGVVDRFLNLTIWVGFMDFKTSEHITNLLFWDWTKGNFTLYYSSDKMTLAKNVADRVRARLEARIVDHIAANINEIQLA